MQRPPRVAAPACGVERRGVIERLLADRPDLVQPGAAVLVRPDALEIRGHQLNARERAESKASWISAIVASSRRNLLVVETGEVASVMAASTVPLAATTAAFEQDMITMAPRMV